MHVYTINKDEFRVIRIENRTERITGENLLKQHMGLWRDNILLDKV